MSTETYNIGIDGGVMKRIRAPHTHDVLSGRGGGINSHAGNIQFREWVRVRKNDYNLAPSKQEKARVAKEVIALVENQDPPGRFLQKDPSHSGSGSNGWWVELDEDRIMAKTSQALREGAPQIRAAHMDVLEENKAKGTRVRKAKAAATPPLTAVSRRSAGAGSASSLKRKLPGPDIVQSVEQVRSSSVAQAPSSDSTAPLTQQNLQQLEHLSKRVRVDFRGQQVRPHEETPPLMPLQGEHPEPLDHTSMPPGQAPLPRRPFGSGMHRSHSLALSDFSNTEDWGNEEFVNPFDEESEIENLNGTLPQASSSTCAGSPSRAGGYSESALAIDIGEAQTRSDSKPSSALGVRSRSDMANASGRFKNSTDLTKRRTPISDNAVPAETSLYGTLLDADCGSASYPQNYNCSPVYSSLYRMGRGTSTIKGH